MTKTVAKVVCQCTGPSAEFQDKKYGKNIRVANLVTKSKKSGISSVDVRCTVCGKTHSVQESSLT